MRYLLIGAVLAVTGCASEPSKGSLEYIDRQVYQCRKLCANSEVNLAEIKGLDCVCSKPQQPVIYNPIVTGSSGGAQPINIPVSIQPVRESEPVAKPDAATIKTAEGRTVFSQVK